VGTRRAQFILNAANLDDTAAEVVAHGGRLYRYSPQSGKLFQDLPSDRVPLLFEVSVLEWKGLRRYASLILRSTAISDWS